MLSKTYRGPSQLISAQPWRMLRDSTNQYVTGIFARKVRLPRVETASYAPGIDRIAIEIRYGEGIMSEVCSLVVDGAEDSHEFQVTNASVR